MTSKKRIIVLASNNKEKLKELSEEMFVFSDIKLISQSEFNVPEVEETGLSFIENAIIKARNAAAYSNLPALADDSGLVVGALNGEPGIYSARYAGLKASDNENIEKLLSKLEGVPSEKRQAHYHCTLAFVRHKDDPDPIICEGRWKGFINMKAIGDSGFGYDPVFYLPGYGCTAAELNLDIKKSVNHRAHARFTMKYKLIYR